MGMGQNFIKSTSLQETRLLPISPCGPFSYVVSLSVVSCLPTCPHACLFLFPPIGPLLPPPSSPSTPSPSPSQSAMLAQKPLLFSPLCHLSIARVWCPASSQAPPSLHHLHLGIRRRRVKLEVVARSLDGGGSGRGGESSYNIEPATTAAAVM